MIIFKACLGEISFTFDTQTYGICCIQYRKMWSEKWQYVPRRLWDLRQQLDDASVSNILAICCIWIIHQSINHSVNQSTPWEMMLKNFKFSGSWPIWWKNSYTTRQATYVKRTIQARPCVHVKYLLFLSYFNETRIFMTDYRQILKCRISWKSVQWKPSCSVRTDGRTDRHDEAHRRFSQFC